MKKLLITLTQRDKLMHFIAGQNIATIVYLVGGLPWAIAAGVTAGLLKDLVWDRYLGRGQYDRLDIVVTILGSIVGAALCLLVTYSRQ